jgi:hypothetical protein
MHFRSRHHAWNWSGWPSSGDHGEVLPAGTCGDHWNNLRMQITDTRFDASNPNLSPRIPDADDKNVARAFLLGPIPQKNPRISSMT